MTDVIYRACKRTIIRGGYPVDMETRLDVFLAAGKVTIEQYNELLGMLSA